MQKKIAGLSQAALTRFVLRARRAVGVRAHINVLVTSNPIMRGLNRQFRHQNKATDVLSFPAAAPLTKNRQKIGLAGELAISADIALQNALRFGHSPSQEVKVLVLHGILHLAGFDHERDNGEMGRKEEKLRAALRLPPSLIERTQARGRPSSPRISSRAAIPKRSRRLA